MVLSRNGQTLCVRHVNSRVLHLRRLHQSARSLALLFTAIRAATASIPTLRKHLKGSYDSAVQALLPDVHTTIKYLAGKGVRDITDMILAGPRHDVLILSILGNDFVHWVRRAKNDWVCDAVETYPHNFDEDLHALVSAVAEKSSRCAFLLFGEASKWGYNHRYDDFSERARSYVDDVTGHTGVVFSGSVEMRSMPLCSDEMHFHRDATPAWTQLWARLVHDAKPIALSHRRSPVATSSIDATDMSASHRSISPLLEEAPAPCSQEDKIFDAGEMPCEKEEILGTDRGAQLLKLLTSHASPNANSSVTQEPVILSTDEFKLWEMSWREDAEINADEKTLTRSEMMYLQHGRSTMPFSRMLLFSLGKPRLPLEMTPPTSRTK